MFVTRLAPVLYSPLWLAVLFMPAAVGALVWQFSTHSQPPGEPAVQVVVEQAPAEPSEDDQLHELFRQAKMMRRAGRMEAIVEEQEGAAPQKRT